jgi:hypothetical protein
VSDFSTVTNKWQFYALVFTMMSGTVVTVVGQLIAFFDNRVKLAEAAAARAETNKKVEQVGQAVNGQAHALAASVGKAEFARGSAEATVAERQVAVDLLQVQSTTAVASIVDAAAKAAAVVSDAAAKAAAALLVAAQEATSLSQSKLLESEAFIDRVRRENAASIIERKELRAMIAALTGGDDAAGKANPGVPVVTAPVVVIAPGEALESPSENTDH